MTAIQPCTAMVEIDVNVRTPTGFGGYITTDMAPIHQPCPVPVAELPNGPCAQCTEPRSKHGRLGWEHCPDVPSTFFGDPMTRYKAPLVHVTLGPCEAEVLHTYWNGRYYAPCGELEDCPEHKWPGLGHPYAPTVTELDVGHLAEVSDA